VFSLLDSFFSLFFYDYGLNQNPSEQRKTPKRVNLFVSGKKLLEALSVSISHVKTPRVSERLVRLQGARENDGIDLVPRVGGVTDLAQCHALHQSLRLPYNDRSWRILSEMWRASLSTGAMQLCLVRNRARLAAARIVSFSGVLFVTDEFCLEARSKLSPYLGVEVAQRFLSHKMPVLSRQQVARANAGDGLNALLCFEGWAQSGFSSEQFLLIRKKQSEAIYLALSGYRLKEFLANPIGTNRLQWMVKAGAHVRRNYSNYFEKNGLPEPEPSQRPWLVGLTKEEAFSHPGSKLADLFIYSPPRFYFNRSQRVLLRQALVGKTRAHLATSLSVSPWTVKKRWDAIYDRVADVDRDLLPAPIDYCSPAMLRGPERRRCLLGYLREHPEELRPYEPARRMVRDGTRPIISFTAGDRIV
jgi:hypothetical protein